MVKEIFRRMSESAESHWCGPFCLGPLTFHTEAVGDSVNLSQGARCAERVGDTFRNGLVFSSRPVKVQERVRLRVDRESLKWHGALRVGFTNVPPTARTVPLPALAIPDLTDTPGHWAVPLPESCDPGSEVEFWVSRNGKIYFSRNNSCEYKLRTKRVDISKPLWAMVDIYGQTCSILLLGSEKKGTLANQKSCPAPEQLPPLNTNSHCKLNPLLAVNCHSNSLSENNYLVKRLISVTDSGTVKECVVCMVEEVSVTLECGHRCLCLQCIPRVIRDFGTCPLCRHKI